MAIKRCISPFTYWVNGAPRTVPAGQIIDEADPAYKGREAHFEDVEVSAARTSAQVEQATAEPGEKRGARRMPPARKTAKGGTE